MVTRLPTDDDCGNPRFEDHKEFNAYLDTEYGDIHVAGSLFPASLVLFEIEPETYRITLREWERQQAEDFKQIVFDRFPEPIAYSFRRFEKGWENEIQRFLFLRDTWEAIILILHAVFVADFRGASVPLKGADIKNRDFYSDRLHDRISTIEKLLDYGTAHRLDLPCLGLCTKDVLERIRELNRVRNEFSHASAKSEEQARAIIEETRDEVLAILREVRAIEDVDLLRFYAARGSPLSIRCFQHRGHHLTLTFESVRLTREQAVDCSPFLDDRHMLIRVGGCLRNAAPFLHFLPGGDGHAPRLLLMKSRGGEDTKRQYV